METNKREELLWEIAHLSAGDFERTALRLFSYQATHNPVYARFLKLLKRDVASVNKLEDIPFLPISFFKTHEVLTGKWQPELYFESSGTTGQTPSRHAVRQLDWYLKNAIEGFEQFYGQLDGWRILALLPSYLERSGSSLVAMTEAFIRHSGDPQSGFFLNNRAELLELLKTTDTSGRQTLLLGVSFALLDLAETHPTDLRGVTVMETGGMKGRRKEITRSELHTQLKAAFHLDEIHSEYGMTELFSQAYSRGGERFSPIGTMRVLARDVYDPFALAPEGRIGVLQMADLANIDTCAFVATEDLGRVYADGTFEVLGRLDAAEIRGCNLMLEMG